MNDVAPELDCHVRNNKGDIIQRSRNLRGIREKCGRDIVRHVAIQKFGTEGVLYILFENGDKFRTNFASYAVLKQTVRNWRNLYGSMIRVNGGEWTRINYNCKDLK